MGWKATSICMAVHASSVQCYQLQYIAVSCLNYVLQVSSASAAQHGVAATGSQAENAILELIMSINCLIEIIT